MRCVLVAGLVLAGGFAAAEEGPVTRREFSIIVGEIEGAFTRGLKMQFPERKASADKTPMPRAEIITELEKLFEIVRPKFTSTPRPFRYDEALIKKHNKGEEIEKLVKLCRWGAAAPAGPLAIGSPAGLTPLELGDALGIFVTQVSALTHQPSPMWTPTLRKGNG